MREQQSPSLFEAALEEFQVTRQISTGQGQVFLPMCGLSKEGIGAFIRDELGYDGPVGDRLYEMVPQERLDARHQERQAPHPAPVVSIKERKKHDRMPKGSRIARMENVRVQAMLQLRRVAA